MLQLVSYLNTIIYVLFFCCYFYQIVFIAVRLFKKMPVFCAKKKHRFAAVIAARNEEAVIGQLIKSIRAQKYPEELIDIYVVADNCTDGTASVALSNGANVFKRNNTTKVGKGYALNYAFTQIDSKCGIQYYDGYFVFDADNVIDENYVAEMNNVFDSGYRVITSYRNSKNYGHNWISAGYGLWFLRESKYLNGGRMMCKTSCAISGTGFLVSSDIINSDEGWKYHLLTEDIEFSVDKALEKEVIGYCERAVLYDEQPVNFKTSWNQRMRWTKGFYQVIRNYGSRLLRGCFSGRKFQCFDMFMTVAPATLLSLAILALNIAFVFAGLVMTRETMIVAALLQIAQCLGNFYLSLFIFGSITLVTEWKNIYCSGIKKILYLFMFPVFLFTYVPITVVALFQKSVKWEPIPHVFAESVTEIKSKTAA